MNLYKMLNLAAMMIAVTLISSCEKQIIIEALPCPVEQKFHFVNVDKSTQVELAKVKAYILKLKAACKG